MKDCIISIMFLISGSLFSQVNVIQFNSSWNVENSFDMSDLKDCETYYISNCDNPDAQKEMKIKSVPTLILLDNGEEVERFEGNIMMELPYTTKDIQKEINKIMLAKFN